jgi:cytochrome c553
MNVQPPSRKRSTRARIAVTSLALLAGLIAPAVDAQTPEADIAKPNDPQTTASKASGDPAGNAQRGFTKSATCLGCHSIPGYKADFPVVYSVPMIGGQNAKYIETALKEYRKGDRRFPSMMATARSLTDQDIADLAAYFSSQH